MLLLQWWDGDLHIADSFFVVAFGGFRFALSITRGLRGDDLANIRTGYACLDWHENTQHSCDRQLTVGHPWCSTFS